MLTIILTFNKLLKSGSKASQKKPLQAIHCDRDVSVIVAVVTIIMSDVI